MILYHNNILMIACTCTYLGHTEVVGLSSNNVNCWLVACAASLPASVSSPPQTAASRLPVSSSPSPSGTSPHWLAASRAPPAEEHSSSSHRQHTLVIILILVNFNILPVKIWRKIETSIIYFKECGA